MNGEKTAKIDRFMKVLKRFMKKPEDQVIISDILLLLENCRSVRLLVATITTATENIYIDPNNIYNVLNDLKTNVIEDDIPDKEHLINNSSKISDESKVYERFPTLINGPNLTGFVEKDSFLQENSSDKAKIQKRKEYSSSSNNSKRFKMDNISLSSDDNDDQGASPNSVIDESDSDVEIINDTTHCENSKDKKCNVNDEHCQSGSNADDVIQIEDSSDDDIQEIKIDTNASFTNKQSSRHNRRWRKESMNSGSRLYDQSIQTTLPFVVQFPTVQSAAINGTLFVSRNLTFSVKLQGFDPTKFNFNNNQNRK